MANPILIKRSAEAAKVPQPADLVLGELALNTTDAKLFMKTGAGTIADLTANQSISVTGDATGSGTTSIALTLANSGVSANTYPKVTVNAKGLVTGGSNLSSGDVTTGLGFTPIDAATKGAVNGVASLDGDGKVPTAQLPAAVLGGLSYQGVWNASTNSPALASGTGTKGYYYKVSVAGTTAIDGNSGWEIGDFIVYNGTTWDWLDGGVTEVSSVFGRVGAVVLQASDVTTALTYTPYNATNPSGYINGNQNITVTGDATGSGTTSISLTLADSGVTAGTVNNSSTAITPLTVDSKGRLTSTGVAVTITPAWGSITSKPTTLAGFGITDAAADTHNHTVDALSNVTIVSKASNDVLQWNGSAWVNKTLAGAGIQPAGAYLTGNESISVTGDATGTGTTSIALTLANSGVAAATYNNSATAITPFTVDAKGRVTATDTPVTITPAWGSITGTPTTLAGYGITDAMASGMTIDGGTY